MAEAGDTTNIAGHNSTVGMQAGSVENSTVYHQSTVYNLSPDASPQEKYQVGLRFLEDGMPTRARELISDAIAHEYDNSEVRFHWVLAALSKRSLHDLTKEEQDRLQHVSSVLHKYTDDTWKHALSTVLELLDCLQQATSDPRMAMKKLDTLAHDQRTKILRHLDLVLVGGLKDSLWAQTRDDAENGQFGNGRTDRIWAYFHPRPALPRVQEPAENSTTQDDKTRAAAWAGPPRLCWRPDYLSHAAAGGCFGRPCRKTSSNSSGGRCPHQECSLS